MCALVRVVALCWGGGDSAYEKQQKRLKALKKSGKVTVDISKASSRDSATKQKQRAMVTATNKNKKAGNDSDDEDAAGQEELLQPLKDYVVRLFFTSAGGAARWSRSHRRREPRCEHPLTAADPAATASHVTRRQSCLCRCSRSKTCRSDTPARRPSLRTLTLASTWTRALYGCELQSAPHVPNALDRVSCNPAFECAAGGGRGAHAGHRRPERHGQVDLAQAVHQGAGADRRRGPPQPQAPHWRVLAALGRPAGPGQDPGELPHGQV